MMDDKRRVVNVVCLGCGEEFKTDEGSGKVHCSWRCGDKSDTSFWMELNRLNSSGSNA